MSSLAELQAELIEVNEEIAELKDRRRELNVAINQARQEEQSEQRQQQLADREARREENRERNRLDRKARIAEHRYDPFDVEMAAKWKHDGIQIPGYQPGDVGCTVPELLAWRERRHAEMRAANPGELPNGGLG